MAKIYHFPGRDKIPSYDYDCMVALTFCKFSDFEVELVSCENPAMSPNEALPFLRASNDTLFAGDEIFTEIRRKKGSINSSLVDPEKIADEAAYKSLIIHKLKRSFIYDCWIESKNFREWTLRHYGDSQSFPLNYILPYLMRSSITSSLLLRTPVIDKQQILKEADQSLKAISDRLNNSDFLFGDKPTEADAYLFAYLFLSLNLPFPTPENGYLINNYKNLVQYTSRISNLYFKEKSMKNS